MRQHARWHAADALAERGAPVDVAALPPEPSPVRVRRGERTRWLLLTEPGKRSPVQADQYDRRRADCPAVISAVDEAYVLKRARTALNDARAFLRDQVPALEGMLVLHRSGGEGGRYRLDWVQITSDARAFRLGLDRARREAALPAAATLGQALGHYRGHLLADRLPGGWPDERRVGGVYSSLRASYCLLWLAAMEHLGHLCLQLGHPDQAATLVRRLFGQEPTDAVAE